MERIDKIIASQGRYSRKEVKMLIARGRVSVDGVSVSSASEKADASKQEFAIDGVPLKFKKNIYLILNKPQGYVSATEDREHPTVLELVPEEFKGRELFPAGRLDKNTTGMMIITDDGVLAHNILAPKKHIPKVYMAELDIPVTDGMREGFERGIRLSDGECKSAELVRMGECSAQVTLHEGRYHQIKRMFGCFGAEVVRLKRIAMGGLSLPDELAEGECRELTPKELELLQERKK